MTATTDIAIVGGGAAGFFGAISAAEKASELGQSVRISIFESSSRYLKKVKISGGGRCNVTHNQFDVRSFCQNYPRGQKELLSPMQKFQAKDMVEWLKKVGVDVVAEDDGRMFPTSNESQTIIDCYMEQVEKHNIQLCPNHKVSGIHVENNEFHLSFVDQEDVIAKKVLIATGSSPGGYKLAEALGHTITERAPSLFSFKIQDPLLTDLQGISFFTSLKLSIPNRKAFKQVGQSLITHWGLSGPAILKLSAWAAREMKSSQYKAKLTVNWMGEAPLAEIEDHLQTIKDNNAKTHIKNSYPSLLPKRFWLKLLSKLKIDPEKQWASLSKKELHQLAQNLYASEFEILGQNRFKDEFVECGGVSLKELNFKTMESKKHPGLHFAGELLDVDGITGGFNFQNAWTTSWIAAQNMISH